MAIKGWEINHEWLRKDAANTALREYLPMIMVLLSFSNGPRWWRARVSLLSLCLLVRYGGLQSQTISTKYNLQHWVNWVCGWLLRLGLQLHH